MRTISHSTRRHKGRLVIAGASALSLAIVGLGTATATAGPTARTAFPGSVPAFVATADDSGTSTDTTVEGIVYLDLKDEAGAQNFATAVSTPGNPSYGKYLSPQAWIKKYAPSKADFKAVKQYLTDSGMTISGSPASREYIVFRGPASDTDAAFDTKLHNYTVDGKTVSAPNSAPSLPKSVASHVLAINLGDAAAKLTRPDSVRPGQGVKGAKAAHSKKVQGAGANSNGVSKNSNSANSDQCSTYAGQYKSTMPEAYGSTSFPTFICGYVPSQLRSAGNLNRTINSGDDGSGVSVGVVDAYASPTIQKDTNAYMLAAGSPLLTKFSDISYAPSTFNDEADCEGPSGWQTEEHIDIQSAHSVAPGAKIVYSGGFNCGGGLTLALSKLLDSGSVDLISNSYGYVGEAIGDDMIRGEQNLHLQAAGEGIGLYFSTGDDGDNSVAYGSKSADWPATSAFVTSVGGTSESIGDKGNYVGEVGWENMLDQVVDGAYTSALPGDEYGGGAGGGASTKIAEPAYQKGVVPTSLSGTNARASRVEPDVSDLADPYTGFQIAVSPITDDSTLATGPMEYQTWGGTSLATPIVAGKMALVQQATGHQIGFANPLLYQEAKQHKSAFHDGVTPSSQPALAYVSASSGNRYLVTQDYGFSLSTATGYDDITGIGSLKTPQLITGVQQALRKGHDKK